MCQDSVQQYINEMHLTTFLLLSAILNHVILPITPALNKTLWGSSALNDFKFYTSEGSGGWKVRLFFSYTPWSLLVTTQQAHNIKTTSYQRRCDVIITSKWRDHVASTLIRRHFDVMCPLGTQKQISNKSANWSTEINNWTSCRLTMLQCVTN